MEIVFKSGLLTTFLNLFSNWQFLPCPWTLLGFSERLHAFLITIETFLFSMVATTYQPPPEYLPRIANVLPNLYWKPWTTLAVVMDSVQCLTCSDSLAWLLSHTPRKIRKWLTSVINIPILPTLQPNIIVVLNISLLRQFEIVNILNTTGFLILELSAFFKRRTTKRSQSLTAFVNNTLIIIIK